MLPLIQSLNFDGKPLAWRRFSINYQFPKSNAFRRSVLTTSLGDSPDSIWSNVAEHGLSIEQLPWLYIYILCYSKRWVCDRISSDYSPFSGTKMILVELMFLANFPIVKKCFTAAMVEWPTTDQASWKKSAGKPSGLGDLFSFREEKASLISCSVTLAHNKLLYVSFRVIWFGCSKSSSDENCGLGKPRRASKWWMIACHSPTQLSSHHPK